MCFRFREGMQTLNCKYKKQCLWWLPIDLWRSISRQVEYSLLFAHCLLLLGLAVCLFVPANQAGSIARPSGQFPTPANYPLLVATVRLLCLLFFFFPPQAIFHTLVNEYTEWSRPVEQPTAILDSLVELLGDGQTVAPTTEAADHVAALSQASPPPQRSSKTTAVPSPRVYFFVFSPSPGNLPSHTSRFYSRLGAPHGTDLAYLLGIPLLPPPPSPNSCASSSPTRFPTLDIVPTSPISPHGTYNDSQVELAKTMIRYFVNFAAYG